MNNYLEKTKRIRKKYLQYFPSSSRVVDIGCGEGEFVHMMSECGFEACGVDSNPVSVQCAQNKGLDVLLGDANSFLKDNKKQFDGIVCSHMIEHVSAEEAGELISSCYDALTEGGILLIITPNIHTLTGNSDFWNDPTHVKPYPEDGLRKLFRFNGLETVKVGYDEDSKIRIRLSWRRYPIDFVRLILGVFIYGKPGRYNELYAVGRK